MNTVLCTDRHPDSEGKRRPCKYREDGACTKKVVHLRLTWDDDAYHLNLVCVDERGEDGKPVP